MASPAADAIRAGEVQLWEQGGLIWLPNADEALCALLDALVSSEVVDREWIDRIEAARVALEAAILRSQP